MLRVIIADDEERICKLIQILADWERLNMQVVGIASNGLEALEMVQTLSPDVLITDIRMPGLGGLELISKAKAAAENLEVIIISGYAQFDYAQTALRYGVGDYLLKPINKETLNHTLEKMGERCMRHKQDVQAIETLLSSTQDDHARLRHNIVTDLIDGRCHPRSAEDLNATYRLDCGADTYQVLLIKIDLPADALGNRSLEIVSGKVLDVFHPILKQWCADYVLDRRELLALAVMNYRSGVRGALRSSLREGLNQLVASKEMFGEVTFSMALGQAVCDAAALQGSYDNACRMILERLTEGTERLLEGAAGESDFDHAAALARYTAEVAHAIEIMSLESAQRAAQALYDAAEGVAVRGWEWMELVRGAGTVFITQLGVDNREVAAFDRRLNQCCKVEALFDTLRDMQRALFEKALADQKNRDGQPIRLAKQYIQKHFANSLTLEEVSEAMGFSVNYFSTLFKRETGEGFNKYLTRVRIEQACAMLRETRTSVQEVCKRVGYTDLKHFTHTFKGITGLTPSEFRKLYG